MNTTLRNQLRLLTLQAQRAESTESLLELLLTLEQMTATLRTARSALECANEEYWSSRRAS